MKNSIFKQIADFITESGLEYTTNGSYYIYFSNIAEQFQVEEAWVKQNYEKIYDELNFDVISEFDIEDDSFRMYFYLQYCCEHCGRYKEGNRNYNNCSGCDCWCDGMEEEK